MSAGGSFTIHLEQLEAYQFNVKFGLPDTPDLIANEPTPLGDGTGPNASRLLATASLRQGIPLQVTVTDEVGGILHQSSEPEGD